MSKSIYDEALEELKDLEIILYYDVSKIKKALKQAQKQNKLLELYKEFYNELKPNVFKFVVGDYESSEYLDFETDDTTKCIEIFNKIKELENDK